VTRVDVGIDIAAPPERVWELVMDPKRLGEWVTIHRKVHRVDSGPPQEGMEMEQTLCLRHTNFKVKWTLTDCVKGKRAVWEGRGPFHSHASTTYELSANRGGGTHFHYSNEFKPPGGPLGTAASRVVVGELPEREARASLQKLKALLENA
jgi:uncharacterized protein YndB with AHSA1/START domain